MLKNNTKTAGLIAIIHFVADVHYITRIVPLCHFTVGFHLQFTKSFSKTFTRLLQCFVLQTDRHVSQIYIPHYGEHLHVFLRTVRMQLNTGILTFFPAISYKNRPFYIARNSYKWQLAFVWLTRYMSSIVGKEGQLCRHKELAMDKRNIIYTRKEPTQARKYFMIVNLPLFCI